MAPLLPSPSGSSRRRLSELLEEQQEPFSLDLYLLDKGCSPTLLDAVGVSDGGATPSCWPRSSRTSPALWQVAASKNTRASGILRLLLSKMIHGTAAAKKKKKKKLQPAAIDWDAVTRSNFKNAVPSPPPRAIEAAMDEAEQEEEEEEEEDDEGSSKQLSPVSVLEQRPFEQAKPAYAQKAVVIFRELLDLEAAAYTPASLDQVAKDSSSNKSKYSRNDTSTTPTAAPPPPPPPTDRKAGALQWEEMLEVELAEVQDIIASEMARARLGPGDVWPERRDVGVDVTAAVLEELTEEIAVEMMGMYHDDAIDNGSLCWCDDVGILVF